MISPLWEPSIEEKESTLITRFSKKIKEIYNLPNIEYSTLHKWSVEHPDLFWLEVWKDCDVCFSKEWDEVLNISKFNTKKSKEKSDWFNGARLNFAENLLSNGER